eukprot:1965789-Prymnesium_polylepis.1
MCHPFTIKDSPLAMQSNDYESEAFSVWTHSAQSANIYDGARHFDVGRPQTLLNASPKAEPPRQGTRPSGEQNSSMTRPLGAEPRRPSRRTRGSSGT